jgi:hypothetical protein
MGMEGSYMEDLMKELNLDDLSEVSGGRYMTDSEKMQQKAAMQEVARIRAALIAKHRYEDAQKIASDYNDVINAYHKAIANSPDGSESLQLSDFLGDTFTRYGV